MNLRIFLIVFFISFFKSIHSQDILLRLTGREDYVDIEKIDTFFVWYYPIIKYEQLDKSNIKMIYSDSLIYNDGKVIKKKFASHLFDKNSPYIYCYETSNKTIKRDRYKYFNVVQSNIKPISPYNDSIKIIQNEKILYGQDTMFTKFELAIEDQRAYTYGRRSARKNFQSPWSTLGGMAVGTIGGFFMSYIYGAIPGAAYLGINSGIKPKMKVISPSDSSYVTNEYFIQGYRNQAQITKIKNSLLGFLPAYGLGIVYNVTKLK